MNKTLKQIIQEAIQNEVYRQEGTSDIMDAIIMVKEAYYDINEVAKTNKTIAFDLSEAMGNLRGALKILNDLA